MRVTRQTPWETALQLVAERLQAAIEAAGPGELVAVLFVKLPTAQALADQVAAEIIGNRGVAQEYISGAHMDMAMEVDTDDLR